MSAGIIREKALELLNQYVKNPRMIKHCLTATAMVYPDKKISSVQPKSIVKRMKEKAFAASVSRDIIRECEKIGIPLPEFAELCLRAMQAKGDEYWVI